MIAGFSKSPEEGIVWMLFLLTVGWLLRETWACSNWRVAQEQKELRSALQLHTKAYLLLIQADDNKTDRSTRSAVEKLIPKLANVARPELLNELMGWLTEESCEPRALALRFKNECDLIKRRVLAWYGPPTQSLIIKHMLPWWHYTVRLINAALVAFTITYGLLTLMSVVVLATAISDRWRLAQYYGMVGVIYVFGYLIFQGILWLETCVNNRMGRLDPRNSLGWRGDHGGDHVDGSHGRSRRDALKHNNG